MCLYIYMCVNVCALTHMQLATHALNCQQQIGAGFSRCRLLEEEEEEGKANSLLPYTNNNKQQAYVENASATCGKCWRSGRGSSRKQRFYLLAHVWWLATCRCVAKIKVKMERNCFVPQQQKQLQQKCCCTNIHTCSCL